MSEVAHETRQEFWRPPLAQANGNTGLPDACERCGTEFMVGAAFCHICGLGRHSRVSQSRSWSKTFGFFRILEFGRVKAWFGVPATTLCAFFIGSAFLIVALVQSFRTVQDFSDFEAIQLWRIQWLMAACAAFLAGILLKGRKSES